MFIDGLKNVLSFWRPRTPAVPFTVLFKKFRSILDRNSKILELMADMGDKLGGEYVFDRQYIISTCESLSDLVFKLISDLSILAQRKNIELFQSFELIRHQISEELNGRHAFPKVGLALFLDELGSDLVEEAGNKLANLGELRNTLGLPTPDGFVITTKAFFDFLEHNQLRRLITERLAGWDGRDEAYFLAMCGKIREAVLAGNIPKPMASHVGACVEVLAARHGKPLFFAVRSSAWGEDSDYSFAGQYESVLGVTPDRLLEAYRRVVASAYSPEAWHYRLHRDYREEEMAMAVGCQLMIDAEVSGAMYSYAPLPGSGERMVVSAAWGLGAPIVEGTAETDTFVLERIPPYALSSLELGHKSGMLVLASQGDTATEPVPADRRNARSLSPRQLDELAQAAMIIERFYKRPQDVEWSFDKDGKLHILQARPLNMRSRLPEAAPSVEDATRGAEVAFSGQGTVAQHGVAIGKVYVVRDDEDLLHFPYGAILVARHTSPRFTRVMRKAQGIITDIGSVTGHMSTIAREYRVPTLVNTGVATRLLRDGDEITLDTTRNVVYRGAIQELSRFELAQEEVFEDAFEYRLLRRLLKRISPLNLVDPHGSDFRPSACRTYHDITRYIHEKAVEELIALSENHRKYLDCTPKRLEADIPLGLMIIDIENGLRAGFEDRSVRTDEIVSVPLRALLDGLVRSGMWATDPVSVDLGSFMSSFTRTFSSALAAPSAVGRNLAVVSREYLNLNLRLGYHFNIVDAFIGEALNSNYIYFRFLGGVTDVVRRNRRARFVADVLERFDFRVELHGDLVVGRTKKVSKERMIDKMVVLGGLIGYARQLDVRLRSDEDLNRHMEEFMGRITALLEVQCGHGA